MTFAIPSRRALLSSGLSIPYTALGSDLIAAWDAERSDLITTVVGVASWKDTVAGYDAVQALVTSQPIWSATSFGGGAGVTFDGTDDQLTCTTAGLLAALPSGSAASELWVLCQQDATDVSVRTAASYGATNANGRQLGRTSVGGVNRGRLSVGDGATGQSVSGSVVPISSRHVLRIVIGATASALVIDGIADGDLSVIPSTTTSRLRLGATPLSSATLFWQGQIALAIVTNPLSGRQANGLTAYMLARRRL